MHPSIPAKASTYPRVDSKWLNWIFAVKDTQQDVSCGVSEPSQMLPHEFIAQDHLFRCSFRWSDFLVALVISGYLLRWSEPFRILGRPFQVQRNGVGAKTTNKPFGKGYGIGTKNRSQLELCERKNRMNPWHVLSTNWMLFWTLTRSDWHSLQGLGLGTWMLSVSSFYLLLAVINVMRGIRVKRNLAVPLVSIEYTLEIYSMPLRRWRSNTINAHNPSINKHK